VLIVELLGVEKVVVFLKDARLRSTEIIRTEMERQAISLTRYIQEQKLSGQVLRSRTGDLRRSITYRMRDTAESFEAIVGTNLSYAGAHELGSKPHIILPKKAKALLFEAGGFIGPRMYMKTQMGRYISNTKKLKKAIAGGGMQFAKIVHHPGTPVRSFLRSALADRGPTIHEALIGAIQKALQ